jgi:hypothetical protein
MLKITKQLNKIESNPSKISNKEFEIMDRLVELENRITLLEKENKQMREIILKKDDVNSILYIKNIMKYN